MNARILGACLLLAAPAAMAIDGKIQPGQWRTTDTVLEMVNPAMPPEAIARRMAKPVVVEYCVHADNLQEMLVGKDKGGLCNGPISFANGRISVSRTCPNSTRRIEGTYTSVMTDTQREATLQLPSGAAKTRSHVVSERIGECK